MLRAAGRYVYVENARRGATTCKDLAYSVHMLAAMGESAQSCRMAIPLEGLQGLVRRERSESDAYLFSWESEPWDTAVVLSALASIGRDVRSDPFVAAAAEWLVSQQSEFGVPSVYGEVWETALAAKALLEAEHYRGEEAGRDRLAEQVLWVCRTTRRMCGSLGDHYPGVALQLVSAARCREPGALSEDARCCADDIAGYLESSFAENDRWSEDPWANGQCLEGLTSWRPQWCGDGRVTLGLIDWFEQKQGADGSWQDSFVETHYSFFGLLELAAVVEAHQHGPLSLDAISAARSSLRETIFREVREYAPEPLVFASQACPAGHVSCPEQTRIEADYKTANAFVVVPFNQYQIRRGKLEEVLKRAGFEPRVADKLPGEDLFCKICRGIRSAHFVVADVSQKGRGNMPLELGLALGLGKKTCVLYKKDPDNPESFPPQWISDLQGRVWEGYYGDGVDRAVAAWIRRERILSREEAESKLEAYLD